MSCVPTGRVGLRPEVSGFVIHEAQTPAARAARALKAAQSLSLEKLAALRQESGFWLCAEGPGYAPAAPAAADAQDREGTDRAEAPEDSAHRGPARWRIHLAAAMLRGQQSFSFALERLKPAERLRDLGAIAALGLRWFGRQALAAPRWAQAVVIIGTGLWLAPWPEFEAPVETPVLAMAAAPVERPRDSEVWKPVPGVIAAWHLEAPELDRSALKYRARRQASGARQDMLSWFEEPTDDGGRPRHRLSGAIAVETYPQRQQPRGETLFVELARRASLVGASIDRMSDAYRINNKFGAVDIAEVVLAGQVGTRTCLAFRHVADGVALQFIGWFCAAPQRPIDRATLTCLLDRIDLISGGDQALRAHFAGVERARRACGSYPVAAAPAGWVDANGRMPDLKLAISDARKK